jgi:hypothetical protein
MKKYYKIFFSFILFFKSSFSLAQQQDPILISPFIGTTLDRVERDYFNILPAIDGFEEAKFYLNPDVSLRAVIRLNRNGTEIDTVIMRYSSLKRLEEHIVANVIRKLSEKDLNPVTVQFDGRKISNQKLITIDDNSLYSIHTRLLDGSYINTGYDLISQTNFDKVEKVVIPSKYNIGDYVFYGGIGGAVLGFTVGAISHSNHDNLNVVEETFQGPIILGYFALGTLAGIGVGVVVGLISGIIFTDADLQIDPKTPSGLAELEPYIDFPKTVRLNE